jgi:predicted TPR repeat methyltransferase
MPGASPIFGARSSVISKSKRPQPKRRRKPDRAAGTLDSAVQLAHQGRLDEAISVCREVVGQHPQWAQAAHLLGLLTARAGDAVTAERALQNAVHLDPQNAAAWNDLGNVSSDQNRLDEAAVAYRRAIEVDPQHVAAYNNLGIVYKQQGRIDDALAAYQRAVELRPDYADAWLNLGRLWKRVGRYDQAVAAFEQVLRLEPTRSEAHKDLCGTWRSAGRIDEARAALDRWLQVEPDHPVAQHLRAALAGGDQTPARASDQYVRQVFDQFADRFDDELTELHYQGPELIAAALAKHLDAPRAGLDILDAGCGTGLCGPVLRPYARRLTGVDLSPQMLERAREKAIFDDLETGELTAYLDAHPETWDLIVACDTLNYFGDLQPVLTAASRALRPVGRLVFTLEHELEHNAPGFVLHPSGRYGHPTGYVQQMLAAAGLRVLTIEDATLRTEAGQPVRGLLCIAEQSKG